MIHSLAIGRIELPGQWEDRTTYQFVSPPHEGLELPLATGRNLHVNATRNSVLLARIPLPVGMTIDAYIVQQTEQLRRALPSFRLNSDTPWKHPALGSIRALDVSLELGEGMVVRQIQFYFPGDQPTQFINLTVSTSTSQYERYKADFLAIFESFVPLSE
jgi:hypothetical protein